MDENSSLLPEAALIQYRINIAFIGWIVGFASSIDSAALPQASAEFGVSEVTESLATGLFLIGFGVGMFPDLFPHSHHLISHRRPLRRPRLRDRWTKPGLYRHSNPLHAIHHGVCARS